MSIPNSTDGANTRPTLVLKGQAAEMTVDLGGGSIADFHLGEDGINPLAWDSRMFAPDPNAVSAMKPRPFGHFLCLDRWGSASDAEKANGMTDHGEAGSVWWEVIKDPVSQKGVIETSMAASLPTAGIRVERRIQLLDAEAVFLATESITNDNAIGRIYNIVQHPSIAGIFLDEKTVVDCNGTTGFTQHETLPNPQERVVQWPNALNDQDQSVDIRFLGEDTEPEVVSYVVEDEYGWVTAVSPSTGLLFGYLWKSDEFPWINLWRNAKDGRPFARGLEFGTSGLHRPGHDLVATGKIFDKAIYRYIDAQETQTFRYVSFLVNIPGGYAGVASVNYDGKTITIEEAGGKGRTFSLMASDLFQKAEPAKQTPLDSRKEII